MAARTYLLRTLAFALLIGAVVAGINYTVDPFAITGFPRISGFNEYKVEINEHARLMKKYQPTFRSIDTLVVGNSRVEMGISPAHECFSRTGMTVYNLGIPGASVSTQLAYALNLIYQQPVNTVFLSVDFTDFISTRPQSRVAGSTPLEQPASGLKYDASGELNPEYHRTVIRDYFKSLFSLDALAASIKTVALQSSVSPDRDDAGFNPARDFAEAVDIEGPRALFDQKMGNLQSKYSRRWYLRDADGQLNAAVADVDAFLSIAAARGIKVYLFTNPFHDSFWDLLRSGGHMPAYADWMEAMESLAQAHPGAAIEFWDFSEDSPYIHESVPAVGVRSGPLQWFWEPAHYRRQLGDSMVSAMLSEHCGTDVAFGRRVF